MAPSTRNPPPEHTPSRHSSSAEPQSLPTQGRPLRASLRSEAAGGTEITFPRQPDARLYSLAKLWQFSKNACNSKHFSLNRSVFVALGVAGTFPDSSAPAGSARPRSPGGTTPLTHGHSPDKESTGRGDGPELRQQECRRGMVGSDLDPAVMLHRSRLTRPAEQR